MKSLLGIALILWAGAASAQVSQESVNVQNFVPTGACLASPLVKVSNVGTYQCVGGAWTKVGPSAGGGGTVTSLAAGTLPAWLGLAIATPTTTPVLNFTAAVIPNNALANASTTVNGQACVLGAACTIATGSGTLNTAAAFSPAYYPTAGTTVSGATPFSGFQLNSTSGPPRAGVQADFNVFLTSPGPIGTATPGIVTSGVGSRLLGDATANPGSVQLVTSTNSGLTANIPLGNLCKITQNFLTSTSNYDGRSTPSCRCHWEW